MCPGFGRRLNSWRVKVCHLAPPRNLFKCLNSNPFTRTTCSTPFPPTPFPIFLPHITSLPAHKTRMIGHDGVLPPTILCEHASQVALAPSRCPTHLLHQNKMSFFLFLFSVSTGQRCVPHTHAGHSAAPVPHASWHADCSPMLATHACRPYYHLALLAKPTR